MRLPPSRSKRMRHQDARAELWRPSSCWARCARTVACNWRRPISFRSAASIPVRFSLGEASNKQDAPHGGDPINSAGFSQLTVSSQYFRILVDAQAPIFPSFRPRCLLSRRSNMNASCTPHLGATAVKRSAPNISRLWAPPISNG